MFSGDKSRVRSVGVRPLVKPLEHRGLSYPIPFLSITGKSFRGLLNLGESIDSMDTRN